jgi:hypothetical protein
MDWQGALQLTGSCSAVGKALCWLRTTRRASDHFNRAFKEDLTFVEVVARVRWDQRRWRGIEWFSPSLVRARTLARSVTRNGTENGTTTLARSVTRNGTENGAIGLGGPPNALQAAAPNA